MRRSTNPGGRPRADRWALVLLLAAAAATSIGCGSGGDLPLAPVTGTVTYQGAALEHGKVVFTPESGTAGPQSVGRIEPDGSFRVQTAGGDGAPLGQHVVTVHCRRPPTPEEKKNLVTTESLIPEKYSRQNESPLKFEVGTGDNEYEIELE